MKNGGVLSEQGKGRAALTICATTVSVWASHATGLPQPFPTGWLAGHCCCIIHGGHLLGHAVIVMVMHVREEIWL